MLRKPTTAFRTVILKLGSEISNVEGLSNTIHLGYPIMYLVIRHTSDDVGTEWAEL